MRGPARKPTEHLLLSGSDRGKARAKTQPKLGFCIPDPPPYLSEFALSYWPYVVSVVEPLRCTTEADAMQLGIMADALASMAADVAQGRPPIRGDRQFHLALAEAAGNGPLLRTVTELFDERNNPLFDQLGQHFETGQTWRLALAEHQAVIDAIAAGQPDAARAAMRAHLQNSHDRFAGTWPHTPSLQAASAGR